MSRVRLTARSRSSADQTPYPGNVNQPDRKDPNWQEYHTFEQRVNHELPDMRHQWQDDSRDDIGFGIPETWGKSPTVASVRVAANKAVRVSMLLLGDKVSDDVVEAQAQDFMAMGPQAMDRTLQRFADTQKLYAEDDAEVDEDDEEVVAKKKAAEEEKKEDEKKAADEEKVEDEKKAADGEAKFTPKIEKPGAEAEGKKAAEEEKKEEKKEDEKDMKAMIVAAVAEAMKAALPDFIQKKVDEKKEKDEKKDDKKAADESEKKDEEKKAAADEKKEDEKAEEKKAADEEKKEDEKKAADESEKDEKADEKKASAKKTGMNEFDIELSASMEDEVAPDPEADERLASVLFPDDQVTAGTSNRKVEASQKKAGISKLGGQPKVASVSAEGVEISSIWQSAPDVSEAFK